MYQWDIVTSVGYTALAVAALRAVATSRPQPLARDDYAESFVRAPGEPYLTGLLADPARHYSPASPDFLSCSAARAPETMRQAALPFAVSLPLQRTTSA